jgi:CBS domain-containing protein
MPAANSQAFKRLSVEHILDDQPLMVSPRMTVEQVIDQMSQSTGQGCNLGESELGGPLSSVTSKFSCALIMQGQQLLGIFTERDVVRLVAEQTELTAVTIAEVMTQPLITLPRSQAQSIFTVLGIMKQHRIRQLPIVDDAGILLGLVTQSSIRRALQPFNFLKAPAGGRSDDPRGGSSRRLDQPARFGTAHDPASSELHCDYPT